MGEQHKIVTEEVWCTVQVEGVHNWPNCPFEEVAYLRDPHRHMFHIKAHTYVTHSDRDVEFIMLKHRVHSYLLNKYATHDLSLTPEERNLGDFEPHAWWKNVCIFGAMSCEMIAKELIEQFGLYKCEVSEDGENGAIVTVEEV